MMMMMMIIDFLIYDDDRWRCEDGNWWWWMMNVWWFMDYDQDQIDDDGVEQDNDVGCDDFYMMWRCFGWCDDDERSMYLCG